MRMLYGTIDDTIGHFRRYERDELSAKLRRAGFWWRRPDTSTFSECPGGSWLLPSFPEKIALFKAFNVIALFFGLLLSYTSLRLDTTPSRIDAVTYVLLIGACPLVLSLTRLPVSNTPSSR